MASYLQNMITVNPMSRHSMSRTSKNELQISKCSLDDIDLKHLIHTDSFHSLIQNNVVKPTNSRPQSAKKFVPPKFIMQKNTNRTLQSKSIDTTGVPNKSSKLNHRSTLNYNNRLNASNNLPETTLTSKQPETVDSNLDLLSVVETMQTKYIENIKVIDKLFDEKKSMESRIQLLEGELRKQRKDFTNSDENDLFETKKTNELSSSAETHNLFETNEIKLHKPNRDQLYDDSIYLKRSSSVQNFKSEGNGLNIDTASTSKPLRRSSSSGRFTLSPNLQADLDRYNQKMEIIRLKEIEKQKRDKEYELLMRDKLLRVSIVAVLLVIICEVFNQCRHLSVKEIN